MCLLTWTSNVYGCDHINLPSVISYASMSSLPLDCCAITTTGNGDSAAEAVVVVIFDTSRNIQQAADSN